MTAAVLLPPVPAMTGILRLTRSTTKRITSIRSSADMVAASPVVPQTMMASVPLMICSSMSRVNAV